MVEDDQELNVLQMIKRYPEWAANRIQAGENVIEDLDRTRKELEALKFNRCDECGAKLSSYPSGCPLCGTPKEILWKIL